MAFEWIDITGLDPAEVLAALWNASNDMRPEFFRQHPTTVERAREWYDNAHETSDGLRHIDYMDGIPMKLLIGPERVEAVVFHRDNSVSAHSIVAGLRQAQRV